TLLKEYLNTGEYKINIKSDNLSSGIYFYSLFINGTSLTKKMILLR
ncbi:MAG: peptidase S8, partial [Ignavibacteriales bacterium]